MCESDQHHCRDSARDRSLGLIRPIGASEFEHIVSTSGKTVVAEFYSTACASCLVMRRMLSALAVSRADEIAVYAINANFHDRLSRRLRVGGTPTVLVFHHGHEIGRMQGVVSWDELMQAVDSRRGRG
jgi:thioredoxin-like negative regulator of GroEL